MAHGMVAYWWLISQWRNWACPYKKQRQHSVVWSTFNFNCVTWTAHWIADSIALFENNSIDSMNLHRSWINHFDANFIGRIDFTIASKNSLSFSRQCQELCWCWSLFMQIFWKNKNILIKLNDEILETRFLVQWRYFIKNKSKFKEKIIAKTFENLNPISCVDDIQIEWIRYSYCKSIHAPTKYWNERSIDANHAKIKRGS